jgi:hypothetical protein
MAIKSKAQIQAESNSTYVDNSVGAITPNSVRALNTDWIDSIIFAEATASLTVFGATSASFATNASTANNAATASFLTGTVASASFAIQAGTASFLLGSVESASFATSASRATSAATATSASYSLTSSLAQRNIITASAAANILTFTKGDGTTFNVSIAQSGSISSASFADTANQANSASLAANSLLLQGTGSNGFVTTGSFATTSGSLSTRVTSLESFSSSLNSTFATDAELNAATQSLSASTSTVNTRLTQVSSSLLQVSASYIALSGSYNVSSGSQSIRTTTLESTASALVLASGSFSTRVTNTEVTSSNLVAASASFSTRVSDNTSNIQTLTSATASYAILGNNQTFTGTNAFNNAVTMSNVKVTGTASIAFLDVTFQSSSVIYSSGSNQFGDASNDTQTLWGTVDIISGPLVVTGSANFKNVITGSISGNAATATTSTSASYAFTASSAISASFASVAASVLGTITSASYAFTASSAVNATNALTASSLTSLNQTVTITGSVNVSGSIRISQNDKLIAHDIQAANVSGIEINNNNAGVIALFGAGGSQGTTFYGQVNGTAFSGSGAQIFGVVSSSFANNANTADTATSATSASYAYTASSAVNATNSLTASFTPNAFVSASNILGNNNIALTRGDGSFDVVTINNVQSASYADNANTANSATTASYALTASYLEGAVSAFPFTGSAGISGSLNVVGALYIPSGSIEITGSATINSGSLVMFSYKTTGGSNRPFEALVTQSLNSTNNIVSVTINSANTGSIVISGSGNYVSLASVAINTQNSQGATLGFSGTNAYVTLLPVTTGSNPNFNTTADRNNRRVPQITNSNVNATIAVNDNRASETTAPVTLSNSSNNMAATVTVQSGSLSISNSQLLGSGTTFLLSGSGTLSTNAQVNNSIISTGGGTVITFNATGSGTNQITNNLIVGNNLRINITGSSSQNSGNTNTPGILDSVIVGRHLVVTGSSSTVTTTANIAVFGAHNTADGLLNDGRFTKFAIGTGASDASRSTAFHVSASGMTTANIGLNVRGVQTGETELEVRATGVKIGNLITDSHNLTGSFAISGSQTITGSLVAETISGSFSGSGAEIFGVVSSSYAINSDTASFTPNAFVSASNYLTKDTLVLFKGDGAQSLVIINNVESASYADNANTANSATSATSASYAYTASSAISAGTASYATQFIVSGSQVITGSLVGQPISQSVASSTASLNLAQGNFFNLTLPASTNTYITASGQVPGQTINLKITQGATTGSVTLGAGFKQVSGSAYTVTATANAVDIVTFISFDETGLYLSNVKNLI